jgi:hypothetical protein
LFDLACYLVEFSFYFVCIHCEAPWVERGGPVLFKSGLERSSTGEEIEDEHDDGEDQKDVDPAAEGVTTNESYDP